MKDRTRLGIGIGLSLVLHGVLFATVPDWGKADEEGTGDAETVPAMEVVSLSPEAVQEILEPRVRPATASLLEAPSQHAPMEMRPWPALEVPRAVESIAATSRVVLPTPVEVPSVVHPPIVDLLRSVTPIQNDLPTPPPETAPPAPAQPPSLSGLRGLVVHREPLSYPASAERRGIEGTASIAVEVGPDGKVVNTRVLRSSGHRVLDRAAQRNLARWRFDAAAVNALNRGRIFRQDVQFQVK